MRADHDAKKVRFEKRLARPVCKGFIEIAA
jgi:hypothetical protein